MVHVVIGNEAHHIVFKNHLCTHYRATLVVQSRDIVCVNHAMHQFERWIHVRSPV